MQVPEAYADVSIKASCRAPDKIEIKLQELKADFLGEDIQTDTYYRVPVGKLKLREGNIENLLTHYLREDHSGKMKTTVYLYERNPSHQVKQEHTASRTIIGKVVKRRKIYWIDNVKFHIDRFDDGRAFVEIEAMDRNGKLGIDTISLQAENYKLILSINDNDIRKQSYIDM